MPGWLLALDRFFPIRYVVWLGCGIGFVLCAFVWVAFGQWGWTALAFAGLVGLGVRDSLQSRRAVLRNYPVIGHLRFLLEYIRPEIRQYFFESDNEAHPFSRQQRSLVYQRAKGDSDKRPFGTQLDVHAQGYEWINHSLAPSRIAVSRLPRADRRRPRAALFGERVQHLGDELRRIERQRHPGAQRRRPARRFRPRHRRRFDQPIPPPERRRPDLGDRFGLLRLPQRRRQLQCRDGSPTTRATPRSS